MKKSFFVCLLIPISGIVSAQVVDVSMLRRHVYTLADDSLMGRGFGTRGGRMAADYIEAQFKEAGISPWKGSYRHPFITDRAMFKIEGCNMIGWVEGSDPVLKDEFIVVGAHYDHVAYKFKNDSVVVYNGADDNASGTATVIELGRWLVQNKGQLKRSVILAAFDGEEAGLIGSSYMVRSNQIPIDRVKMMFSLDMVGMLAKYGGVDLVGDATLQDGAEWLSEIASRHGIAVKKNGKRIEMQTDTSPFGKKGIPAVHVFTSTVSPYHKPQDDANLLDYDGMVTIAGLMADVVTSLSVKDSLQPDRQFLATVNGKGFRPKFGVKLGVGAAHHDYKGEYFLGKSTFAAQVGFYSQVKLSRVISLQPELLYQTRGSKHDDGVLRTHELTVPLNIRVRLFAAMEDIVDNQMFFYGGPYYSYRFAGTLGGGKMDFDNEFRRDEYGVQYGFGFDIMRVQILFGASSSFRSLGRDDKIMQKSAMFSLGYRF